MESPFPSDCWKAENTQARNSDAYAEKFDMAYSIYVGYIQLLLEYLLIFNVLIT